MTYFVIADIVAGDNRVQGALTEQDNITHVMFDWLVTIKGLSIDAVHSMLDSMEFDLENQTGVVRDVDGIQGGVYIFATQDPTIVEDVTKVENALAKAFPMDFTPDANPRVLH